MDRVSALFARAALLWLLTGGVLGALMLSDTFVPGDWRAWFAPTHGHILFVGWFLQFAVGIGYWLLPRRRSPVLPLGYRERPALSAAVLLNLGLALRVVAEPAGRMGHPSRVWDVALAVSSLLQLAAITIIVVQFWSRVGARKRGAPTAGTT